MIKKELTAEESVEQAVEDIRLAMLENIEASKAEYDAKARKKRAYHTLLKAKERMRGVEQDLMETALNL